MKAGKDFRLDWHPEFRALSPFLKRDGGVVVIEYSSIDAAPEKFNHLMKEEFSQSGNLNWVSLRIDNDWYTTRQIGDILDEFERLLGGVGFQVETTLHSRGDFHFIADNEVGGDLKIHLENVNISRSAPTWTDLKERIIAIGNALVNYQASGGRFMLVINDASLSEQSNFWNRIWHGGLEAYIHDSFLLVIHSGPRSERKVHPDAPEPNLRIFLPDSVEADESRQDSILDDLIDICMKNGVENPDSVAATYLECNKDSVRNLNANLIAKILDIKSRVDRRRA